jgi:hypothetical protein
MRFELSDAVAKHGLLVHEVVTLLGVEVFGATP